MAIPAAWFIITWGDSTLEEVQDIDVEVAVDEETLIVPRGGDILPAPATGSIGRMVMTGFSEKGLLASELGQSKLMVIKKRSRVFVSIGGDLLGWRNRDAIIWSGYCRLDRRRVQATVNGAVLFAFAFKFISKPDATTGTETDGGAASPP